MESLAGKKANGTEIAQALLRPAETERELVLTSPEPMPLTEIDLLKIAITQNGSIDIIERLDAMHDKAVARHAEQQFNDAMNRAQSEIGRVAPDAKNPQTHSSYASYAALDRVLRPIYTRNGFSLSFDTDDSPVADTVRVLCFVSHRAGHTRKYRTDMPADGKGAKGGDVMTKTHASGAAMSYGMRYLLKMIFNVAIGEADTDGNDASGLSDERYVSLIDGIKNANSIDELKNIYFAANKEASEAGDTKAQTEFSKAKNAKYRELK